MKSYRKELVFNIPGRRGFVNITPQIQKALEESGIREGLLLCNAMHITASVFIKSLLRMSLRQLIFTIWRARITPTPI